jgi:hypothetical protein
VPRNVGLSISEPSLCFKIPFVDLELVFSVLKALVDRRPMHLYVHICELNQFDRPFEN